MKILLVRPDGIGDEILCLPVASALRRQVPDSYVTFLSSDYASPVLQHHPDLDEILTVSGRERFGELVALFRRGFDAAVFLKPFRRLMAAAWVARVPLRVATGYRWYSLLANRRVYQHRRDFSKHESEYNLGLLAGLGSHSGPLIPPALVLTEAERQWGEARLVGLPPRRVIVHPGGFSSRHWRGEHYWSLASRLAREGFGVILTGTTAERERFCAEALDGEPTGRGILDLMGRLRIRELMGVIKACQVLVSGTTGPSHLAAALGVATVTLFDPRRSSSPTRWRPMGMGAVLRPEVPTCERCVHEACPYWDCLDRITVEQAAERINQMVAHARSLTMLHA